MHAGNGRCRRPSYNCDGCYKRFTSIDNLNRHTIDCKYYQCIYECPYCDFTSSLKGFKKHVVDVHGKQIILQGESIKSPSSEIDFNPRLAESKNFTYKSLSLPGSSSGINSGLSRLPPVLSMPIKERVLSRKEVDHKMYNISGEITAILRQSKIRFPIKCPKCVYRTQWPNMLEKHIKLIHTRMLRETETADKD